MAKDIKPITEIKQNGNDFVITSKTPGKTVTNSFTIGKEAEITTMDGKKLKVCLSVAQNLHRNVSNIVFGFFFTLRMHDFVNASHRDTAIVIMRSGYEHFLLHDDDCLPF